MKDGTRELTNNQWLLKADADKLPATYAELVTLLTGAGLPFGRTLLSDGWTIEPDQLNKANLLTDATAALFGLSGAAATVNNALRISVPAGSVLSFARSTAPSGFLKCDGSAISRTVYADLYSAIGTVFGVGDGSTTFNLPDLRGEFVRGWDDGRGKDTARVFGTAQGATKINFCNDMLKGTAYGDEPNTIPPSTVDGYTKDALQGSYSYITGSSGSGGSEYQYGRGYIRPYNVALLYCIKY